MASEKIIQFYPKDSSNVFFSDMTDNGFDENCIHFLKTSQKLLPQTDLKNLGCLFLFA